MSEMYKFFDSTPGDIREYTAKEFTDYFARFLSDGIYVPIDTKLMGLKVNITSGFNVRVEPGVAYIDGKDYESDANISITIARADTVLDRIDRVVVRLDMTNRVISTVLKRGTLGSRPNKPELTYNANIKEIPLASIRVNKGNTTGVVTDERYPVSSLIEIPYEDMLDEFNEWFDSKKNLVGANLFTGNTEPTEMIAGDIWFREVR